MSLASNFESARYTFAEGSESPVTSSITKLPLTWRAFSSDRSSTDIEVSLAYQKTKEQVPTQGSNVDFIWRTKSIGFGLLHSYQITNNLHLHPSLRLGTSKTGATPYYNGTDQGISSELQNGIYNWETSALVTNIGLGLEYDTSLFQKHMSISSTVHQFFIDSYNESIEDVKYNERATILETNISLFLPFSDYGINWKGRFSLISDIDVFLSENRHTLGYTAAYAFGGGLNIDTSLDRDANEIYLNAKTIWARNMSGWLMEVGYSF
jgi:hypothetical protein